MPGDFGELKKSRERPVNVPATWLTRQQAEQALDITPYLLRKYINELATQDPPQFIGTPQAGYLDPVLVEAIRVHHGSVEKVTEKFISLDALQTFLSCGYDTLQDLIRQHPPDPESGEVKTVRNRNSEIHPHYSLTYARRLKSYHGIPVDRGTRSRSTPSIPTVHIPSGPIREPRPTQQSELLDEEAMRNFRQESLGLQKELNKLPHTLVTARVIQLKQQWISANSELENSRRLPLGWNNLVEQTKKIVFPDEDE